MGDSFPYRKLTQKQLLAELHEAYGENPMGWAFQCPTCKTVTTGQQLSDALKAHPRYRRDSDNVTTKVITSDVLGQECIGRTDPHVGCDWAAYGLFRGPWEVETSPGKSMWCFPIAPMAKEQETAA